MTTFLGFLLLCFAPEVLMAGTHSIGPPWKSIPATQSFYRGDLVLKDPARITRNREYRNAKYIFVGKVLSVTVPSEQGDFGGRLKFGEYEVTGQVLKGGLKKGDKVSAGALYLSEKDVGQSLFLVLDQAKNPVVPSGNFTQIGVPVESKSARVLAEVFRALPDVSAPNEIEAEIARRVNRKRVQIDNKCKKITNSNDLKSSCYLEMSHWD